MKIAMEVDLPYLCKDDIRYTPHFGERARKLREAIE